MVRGQPPVASPPATAMRSTAVSSASVSRRRVSLLRMVAPIEGLRAGAYDGATPCPMHARCGFRSHRDRGPWEYTPGGYRLVGVERPRGAADDPKEHAVTTSHDVH